MFVLSVLVSHHWWWVNVSGMDLADLAGKLVKCLTRIPNVNNVIPWIFQRCKKIYLLVGFSGEKEQILHTKGRSRYSSSVMDEKMLHFTKSWACCSRLPWENEEVDDSSNSLFIFFHLHKFSHSPCFCFSVFTFKKTPFAGQASKEEPAFWLTDVVTGCRWKKTRSLWMSSASQFETETLMTSIHRDAWKKWKDMRRNTKEL